MTGQPLPPSTSFTFEYDTKRENRIRTGQSTYLAASEPYEACTAPVSRAKSHEGEPKSETVMPTVPVQEEFRSAFLLFRMLGREML
jgi:hypothetical protein